MFDGVVYQKVRLLEDGRGEYHPGAGKPIKLEGDWKNSRFSPSFVEGDFVNKIEKALFHLRWVKLNMQKMEEPKLPVFNF